MIFKNRFDAGIKLASNLEKYKKDTEAIVISIPRGGVEVGFYVCEKLFLPMEVTIAKKIGAPFNSELAIGAVAEENTIVFNKSLMDIYNIPEEYIKREAEKKKKEIKEKLTMYRKNNLLISIENKKVILIDDGIATGATIKAVIKFLKKKKANKIIVAVPVAAEDTFQEIEQICDEIICPLVPSDFEAVGSFYDDFNQVTDEQVIKFINKVNNVEK